MLPLLISLFLSLVVCQRPGWHTCVEYGLSTRNVPQQCAWQLGWELSEHEHIRNNHINCPTLVFLALLNCSTYLPAGPGKAVACGAFRAQ